MGQSTASVEKITVSLPEDLVRYADNRAATRGVSRSHVIGDAVSALRAREEEQLAGDGYAFYGHESEAFAAASLKAVSEAIEHAREARRNLSGTPACARIVISIWQVLPSAELRMAWPRRRIKPKAGKADS